MNCQVIWISRASSTGRLNVYNKLPALHKHPSDLECLLPTPDVLGSRSHRVTTGTNPLVQFLTLLSGVWGKARRVCVCSISHWENDRFLPL